METLTDLEALVSGTPDRVALTCATALCASLQERFTRVQQTLREAWDALEAQEAAAAAERERAAAAARTAARAAAGPLATLRALIGDVDNPHQRDILRRLEARSEAERLYLVDYVPNPGTDRKKVHVQGTFTMLGSMNARGQRSEYTVQLYRHGSRPQSFWCNCPDHKFNSSKKGILCKHISFLLVRYARLLCPNIFADRSMTEDQARTLSELLLRPLRETPELRDVLTQELVSFLVDPDRVFQEDDTCPICCEGLGEAPPQPAVACPTCRQCMHRDCVSVWLERKDTCVMCRSDVWKQFRRVAA